MARRLFGLFMVLGVLVALLCGALLGLAAFLQVSGGFAVIYWVAAAVLLAAVLALLSRQFVKLLLEPFAAAAKDLDELEKNMPYPELMPFIEALRERYVQREENVRQRQEFSANVSHELKTPLTSISGYAEMIETGIARDEDVKEFAGKIHAEAGRLIDLIRDILKLSELDEPQAAEGFSNIELLPIAQDTAGLLIFSAERAEVDLSVHGCYAQVFATKELLEELIYNLCDNSIRYNRPGGWVRVTVAVEEDGGVRLTVADNGIGIPPEHQERIFERFYRADKSRSKASGGTGLGLAIVKHIVIQLGAKLTLQSREGEGTEISILFPNPANVQQIKS